MGFSVILPEINGKSGSTRDLVISVLSKEWPLTSKEIFARLVKAFASPVTYQAVHKTVAQLVDQKVLVRTDSKYAINPQWLDELAGFARGVKEVYTNGGSRSLDETQDIVASGYLKNYAEAFLNELRKKVEAKPKLHVKFLASIECGGREETGKPLNIVKLVETSAEPLLLLGGPGCGKTIALYQMAFALLRKKELTPIYFNFANYAGESLSGLIVSRISLFTQERLNPDAIEGSLENGKFLLLFDGLNEAVGEVNVKLEKMDRNTLALESIKKFVARYPKNKFVVACRTGHDPMSALPFKAVAVQPLTREMIKMFLKNSGQSPKLFKELEKNRGLFELTSNPLLLGMLVSEYAENGFNWKTKSELYKSFLNRLLYQWETHVSAQSMELVVQDAQKLFGALAFKITPKGMFVSVEELEKIGEGIGFSRKYVHELKALGVSSSIMQYSGKGKYQFAHLSFQSYFSARHLRFLLENAGLKIDSLEFKKIVSSKEWRETLTFLVGVSNNPSQLLLGLSGQNAYLAAQLLPEASKVSLATQDIILNKLVERYGEGPVELHSTESSNLRGKSVIRKFKATKNVLEKRHLAWVLGSFRTKEAEKLLLKSINSKDVHLAYHALIALEGSTSAKVVAKLRKLTKNKDPIVRAEAISVLAGAGAETADIDFGSAKEQATIDLVPLLKSENHWVVSHAIRALANLRGVKASSSLYV